MTDTRGPTPSKLDTAHFIREIAARMFLPEETIEAVLHNFETLIEEVLATKGEVSFRSFGIFVGRSGVAQLRTAVALRDAIMEKHMEKYGVEIDNEAVLLAKVTGLCPKCKNPLESKDPCRCKDCGTEPFEKRNVE